MSEQTDDQTDSRERARRGVSKSQDNEGYQMAAVVAALGLALCLACLGIGGCTYLATLNEHQAAERKAAR
jgi:hypothetical protein